MYCIHCGKINHGECSNLPVLRKPGSAYRRSRRLVLLYRPGKAGRPGRYGILVRKTYSQVFYTIKSMIRDDDAVFDILQDTYIKVFTHWDTFSGDSKFPSWVRQSRGKHGAGLSEGGSGRRCLPSLPQKMITMRL